MIEEWRDVTEFPDLYEVSSLGRVRSKDRVWPNQLTGGTSLYKGKLLKGRVRKDGYYEYLLSVNGKNTYRNGHRLVGMAFLGPAPEGKPLVLHNDGSRDNNVVTNLRWGSNSENMKDRLRHGTDPSMHKTHCPKGHPYSGENLIYDSGSRRCRTCRTKRPKKQTADD